MQPATVEAGNWLAALGLGLDRLGVVADIHRLACEVLPNGTVIARDVKTGSGFVVRPEQAEGEGPDPSDDGEQDGSAGGGARFAEPSSAESGFANVVMDEHLAEDEVDTVVDDEEEDEYSYQGMDSLQDLPPDALELLDDPSSSAGNLALDDLEEDDEGELRDRIILDLLEGIRRAPSDLVAWQTALDVALALVPSEAGSVLQQEDDGGVRFVGTVGPGSHRLAAVKLPRGTGIVGFCLDRIASLIVQDPKNDPRFFKGLDEVTGFATKAVLCVPVAMEGEVFGCIELVNPPHGILYDRTHIELVELVAGALADRLATESSPS